MSFRMQLGAAVAAVGLAFSAASAAAATYIVTYTGTVASSDDKTHLFGIDDDLFGQAFTLSFSVNTNAPGLSQGDSGPYWDTLQGAELADGVFTLAGKTVTFGAELAYDYREDGSLDSNCDGWMCQKADVEHFAGDYITGDFHYRKVSALAHAYSYNGLFSGLAHTAPGSFSKDDGADFYGWFASQEYTTDANGVRHDISDTEVMLKIDRMTVTTSAAPEPQTWTLAILGFGLTGAMLRRRRAALAHAMVTVA